MSDTVGVGQTYERRATGVIYTVHKVEQTMYTYGENGAWKNRLCPRLELMAVVPAEKAGHIIHETVPTGDLCHYGYTRLA